jgi:hypothetical protein
MRYKGTMRCLLLCALAALAAACGEDSAPVVPVTLQPRPGRPGERFAVRVEHKTINPVSAHQSVEVSVKGDWVDEMQPAARVLRSGSVGGEEFRLELTSQEGHLVNDRGERQDAFGQFEALLPTRAVRPGDRWQARDFWGTWARSFPAPAPKLRSVRAACAYRGADDRVATIRVEILVETFEGPWALAGDLAYDLAAGMLVRVELKGTGKGFRQELTAERALLDR